VTDGVIRRRARRPSGRPRGVLQTPYAPEPKANDHMTMRLTRTLVLGAAFVAVLALASSAAALPKALINQFTGPRLIRAEVLVLGADGAAQDYRIDRGVIVGISGAGLSVRELNGDVVPVAVSTGVTTNTRPATGGGQYRRGMRVVVYQLTGATPTIVQGDSVNAQFFGPKLIRAEVLLLGAGGAPQDYRIDRGTVVSAASGTLTLRESNGDIVPLSVDPAAAVQGGGRKATAPTLRRGWRVVVYRQANAPAQLVQVEGLGP
jgi:hypothetical protein